jgi:aspartyl-tRNA(Asn)/glutamyl-tRNA(Gln) amidotransferase subunit A
VDVLISPTSPTTAFRIGERVNDPLAMYLSDLCTIPSNLAGNAALSVPAGLADDDGLPVGLQVMAPTLADDRAYRVAAAYEATRDATDGGPLWRRVPDLTEDRLPGPSIDSADRLPGPSIDTEDRMPGPSVAEVVGR